MPRDTAVLRYAAEFSSEELDRISLGSIPREMEDKWFIYLDGTTLRVHRSWTGFCIYEVELEAMAGKHVVRRALVNRDKTQYGGTDDAYDSALLNFLICDLLLGKPAEFPDPAASGGSANRRPWWKFW